eukprot:Seg1131.5 transcript_id=Seg1131.5/GoldUCD/mRNA.D3Y31 product="Metabotropic glutamate receptor 3" protein_id=Seg1131.5/GoldUCD/D3Y31
MYSRIYDSCSNAKKIVGNIGTLSFVRVMGLVGPSKSEVVVNTAPKMAVLSQITLGYAASAIELSDRERYGTFFRTIPSDKLEVRAIIDLVNYFNWTYVSTVSSYGYSGQQSMDALFSQLRFICVATRCALPKSPKTEDYDRVISKLLSSPKANVVILLAKDVDIKGLLRASEANSIAGDRFTWVSGTKLLGYKGFIRGAEKSLKGALVLSYANMTVPGFDDYINNLRPSTMSENWLREMWEEIFNCTFSRWAARAKGLGLCSGNETTTEEALTGPYRHLPVKAVISGVHSVACAVRKFIEKHCIVKRLPKTACKTKLQEFYTPKDPRIEMLSYFQNENTHCPELPYSVNFDKQGGYIRNFNILNFDGNSFHVVGNWKAASNRGTAVLEISSDLIKWKSGNSTPVSVCSTPCKDNEIKMANIVNAQCCFHCKTCSEDSIVLNNTCVECPKHQMPNENRDQCYNIPVLNIAYGRLLPASVIVSSTIGFLSNTVLVVVLIVHFQTHIIKASSRELSLVILLSLYAMFAASLTFIAKPTISICALRRFMVGIGLTSCYCSLMLKTNRIHRIFLAAKTVSTPSLVSTKSQIIIYLLLLGLQIFLSFMWFLADPPTIDLLASPDKQHLIQTCKSNGYNFLINLSPAAAFMLTCTYYAYKTRKFPENFNEAASIGFTLYVSCIVWAVFIPMKLWLQTEVDNVLVSEFAVGVFSNLVGLVTLFGLFGPKVYRIFFRRQQENGTFRFFLSSQSRASTASTGFT